MNTIFSLVDQSSWLFSGFLWIVGITIFIASLVILIYKLDQQRRHRAEHPELFDEELASVQQRVFLRITPPGGTLPSYELAAEFISTCAKKVTINARHPTISFELVLRQESLTICLVTAAEIADALEKQLIMAYPGIHVERASEHIPDHNVLSIGEGFYLAPKSAKTVPVVEQPLATPTLPSFFNLLTTLAPLLHPKEELLVQILFSPAHASWRTDVAAALARAKSPQPPQNSRQATTRFVMDTARQLLALFVPSRKKEAGSDSSELTKLENTPSPINLSLEAQEQVRYLEQKRGEDLAFRCSVRFFLQSMLPTDTQKELTKQLEAFLETYNPIRQAALHIQPMKKLMEREAFAKATCERLELESSSFLLSRGELVGFVHIPSDGQVATLTTPTTAGNLHLPPELFPTDKSGRILPFGKTVAPDGSTVSCGIPLKDANHGVIVVGDNHSALLQKLYLNLCVEQSGDKLIFDLAGTLDHAAFIKEAQKAGKQVFSLDILDTDYGIAHLATNPLAHDAAGIGEHAIPFLLKLLGECYPEHWSSLKESVVEYALQTLQATGGCLYDLPYLLREPHYRGHFLQYLAQEQQSPTNIPAASPEKLLRFWQEEYPKIEQDIVSQFRDPFLGIGQEFLPWTYGKHLLTTREASPIYENLLATYDIVIIHGAGHFLDERESLLINALLLFAFLQAREAQKKNRQQAPLHILFPHSDLHCGQGAALLARLCSDEFFPWYSAEQLGNISPDLLQVWQKYPHHELWLSPATMAWDNLTSYDPAFSREVLQRLKPDESLARIVIENERSKPFLFKL